jgi:hypothetical protein
VLGAHAEVLFDAVWFAGVVLFPWAVLLAEVLLVVLFGVELLFEDSSSGPQPINPTQTNNEGAMCRNVFNSPLRFSEFGGRVLLSTRELFDRIFESTPENNSLSLMPQRSFFDSPWTMRFLALAHKKDAARSPF